MLLDTINLNHIRVFECVYRTRSMTLAAQELHLTQSGVSQHVKTFEDSIGVKLFDRIKQRLVPTGAANGLYRSCSSGLMDLEHALSDLKGGEKKLVGPVRIGMPIEFGNNVILPLLARFGGKHPLVRFELIFDFASAMNEGLLDGTLDFAFIDSYAMDRRVTTEPVYDEVRAAGADVEARAEIRHERLPGLEIDEGHLAGATLVGAAQQAAAGHEGHLLRTVHLPAVRAFDPDFVQPGHHPR